MRRALALVALEARTERRYGVHATGVVLAGLWTAVLLAVPATAADVLTPLVLFVDTATVGVFLAGAIVLFERGEHALAAMAVTPLRIREYVAAKATTLTGLSLAIAVPVALAGTRGRVDLAPALAGVALTALLMLLLALAIVAKQRSITGFLTVAPWPLLPLMGIPLAHGLGLLDHPLAYVVPTTAAFDVIAAGSGGPPPPLLGVAYHGVWVAVAAVAATRRLRADIRGPGP